MVQIEKKSYLENRLINCFKKDMGLCPWGDIQDLDASLTISPLIQQIYGVMQEILASSFHTFYGKKMTWQIVQLLSCSVEITKVGNCHEMCHLIYRRIIRDPMLIDEKAYLVIIEKDREMFPCVFYGKKRERDVPIVKDSYLFDPKHHIFSSLDELYDKKGFFYFEEANWTFSQPKLEDGDLTDSSVRNLLEKRFKKKFFEKQKKDASFIEGEILSPIARGLKSQEKYHKTFEFLEEVLPFFIHSENRDLLFSSSIPQIVLHYAFSRYFYPFDKEKSKDYLEKALLESKKADESKSLLQEPFRGWLEKNIQVLSKDLKPKLETYKLLNKR